MIQPKEVRIGNFVEYDGRVFELYTISEELPCLNTIEFGIGVVDWNNLKPIPLTAEWLERFGFEKAKNNRYSMPYLRKLEDNYRNKILLIPFNEINPEYDKGTYSVVVSNKSEGVEFSVCISSVTYVHELQNTFYALTGTELTRTELVNQK